MQLQVSVVIPVHEDLEELERLLGSLAGLAPAEIIVVDGGATHSAQEVATRHGARYVATRAGRGHQLDLGARLAVGDVLWFLHADAEVAPESITAIRAAIADGANGGWFRFAFRGPLGRGEAALAALINLRCRLGGIPYGDQGLFVTRAMYAAVGGFTDLPLFEEVQLVRGARRQGQFVELPSTIGVSPRRWQRDGWMRRTVLNRLLALGHALGIAPEQLARWYHRGHRDRDVVHIGRKERS